MRISFNPSTKTTCSVYRSSGCTGRCAGRTRAHTIFTLRSPLPKIWLHALGLRRLIKGGLARRLHCISLSLNTFALGGGGLVCTHWRGAMRRAAGVLKMRVTIIAIFEMRWSAQERQNQSCPRFDTFFERPIRIDWPKNITYCSYQLSWSGRTKGSMTIVIVRRKFDFLH
jgi:hypothetical protein